MPDILIRGVPELTLRAIDQSAREQRLSRNDYLRRQLESANPVQHKKVTREDLERSARVFHDLLDPDVMRGAWS